MVEEDDEDLEPPLHRLCPTYAQDINSPLRHVRTRIYFTSESHVHSLINVLRYCQLGTSAASPSPILSLKVHTTAPVTAGRPMFLMFPTNRNSIAGNKLTNIFRNPLS